ERLDSGPRMLRIGVDKIGHPCDVVPLPIGEVVHDDEDVDVARFRRHPASVGPKEHHLVQARAETSLQRAMESRDRRRYREAYIRGHEERIPETSGARAIAP